ncbi:MAG: hypothetical protein AAF399_22650 [Bacteroidota bacterium]
MFVYGCTNQPVQESDSQSISQTEIMEPTEAPELIDLVSFYQFSDGLTAIYQERGLRAVVEYVDQTLVPGKAFWFSEEPAEGKFLIFDRAIVGIDGEGNPKDESQILALTKPRDLYKGVTVVKKWKFSPPCQVEIYTDMLEAEAP